jgi:hypothetical protein
MGFRCVCTQLVWRALGEKKKVMVLTGREILVCGCGRLVAQLVCEIRYTSGFLGLGGEGR